MIAAVADTHAALWHLFDDKRLSRAARGLIDDAATNRQRVLISSISLAEIIYLIEKGRLAASSYHELKLALADPDHVLKEAPFTSEIVDSMQRIPREAVPDLPDRIVAATAVYFGVPVLSRDSRIRTALISTIW